MDRGRRGNHQTRRSQLMSVWGKKKSRGKAYGQYFKETIIGCKRDVLQGNNERDARRGMRVKPNKVNELWKVKYLPFTDYTATVADSAEKLKKPS